MRPLIGILVLSALALIRPAEAQTNWPSFRGADAAGMAVDARTATTWDVDKGDGAEFIVLATNRMGEVCMATPAISQDTLFFRTQGHVIAVGTRK